MSESLLVAAFLSLSGGLQDAYTYFARGKVFANAQTGNIVLMSSHLFDGDFPDCVRYLLPLVSFALGIMACEWIRTLCQEGRRLHWRQLVVFLEVLVLFLVGFLPERWNLLANSLVSFSCAMQVQAFRKVHGYGFASTMCIGNLRSGMDSLFHAVHERNRPLLCKSLHYFAVILLFALGAGLGWALIGRLGLCTIWVSCLLLAVSFVLMFQKGDASLAQGA